MLNAHFILVIIATIILVIIAEVQKLRNISWILTIGCIAYVFLSITPDDLELRNNVNNSIDTTIANNYKNNNLEDISTNKVDIEEVILEDNSVDLVEEQIISNVISDDEIIVETVVVNTLKVNTISIAKSIQEREPIELGSLFLNDINELFCHTGIDNPFNNNRIIHTWQYNGNDYLKSFLKVGNSSNWRCWSRISLNPELIGDWSVVVSDTTGNILESIEFTIIPTEI